EATAAAKRDGSEVGWKGRAWKRPGTARPTRHITSTAAIVASSAAAPEARVASATASAVGTAAQPVWTMASSRVSSKSRPWASAAFASTALGAPTLVPPPMIVLLAEGGAGALPDRRPHGMYERGEMSAAVLPAEALVHRAREAVRHRHAHELLERRQGVPADRVRMRGHVGNRCRDDEAGMTDA